MPNAVICVAVSFAVITVVLNLIILGLNIKLYTEYFKDRSQSRRSGPS